MHKYKIKYTFFYLFWICLLQFPVSAQELNRQTLIKYLEVLSAVEMEGRRPGTPGHNKAHAFIIKTLKGLGVQPHVPGYTQSFTMPARAGAESGKNILGVIPGMLDSIIVISAHYDHLGIQNGAVFYGADDNASGVAALLAIAQYFATQKPNHTIVFAAFDAEESALLGSRHFVRSLSRDHKVMLNINMDMISRSSIREIFACGAHHYPKYAPWLEKVNKRQSVTLSLGHDNRSRGQEDWTYSSDHAPFHRENIPFIYFGVEDHPDYHKSTDTFDKIDQEFYFQVANMILDFVIQVDKL